jgi:chromosomal replication initiation ATPase DnaA
MIIDLYIAAVISLVLLGAYFRRDHSAIFQAHKKIHQLLPHEPKTLQDLQTCAAKFND